MLGNLSHADLGCLPCLSAHFRPSPQRGKSFRHLLANLPPGMASGNEIAIHSSGVGETFRLWWVGDLQELSQGIVVNMIHVSSNSVEER